jgi:hypothetical protein
MANALEAGRTKHLNDYLMGVFDKALSEAVQAVEDGKVEQVDISGTFSVVRDEEEGVVVKWRFRDVDIHKGTWKPSAFGQMTLVEEG